MNLTEDGMLDAIAWTRAELTGDMAGKLAIARSCDPVALVDSITALFCGLLCVVSPNPEAHLEFIRANVDQLLGSDDE